MKTRRWRGWMVAVTVLAVAFWGLRHCAWRWWEGLLFGPFNGMAPLGSLPSVPTSSLAIEPLGRLEVYEVRDSLAPVLILRAPGGNVVWSRRMVPSRKNRQGAEELAGVRDMRLQNWRRRGQEILVYFACDWDWGGQEGGLIYLDQKGNFKHFGVSW